MPLTTPQHVEQIVRRSPFLVNAMTNNLINLSALARSLQPEIEKTLNKKASEASIMMALKRLIPHLSTTPMTSLVELRFPYSPDLLEHISQLAGSIHCTFTEEMIRLITSQESQDDIITQLGVQPHGVERISLVNPGCAT